MFAKKRRWTRSRTSPKHDSFPACKNTRTPKGASPYNASSSPFKCVFPRSVFYSMQIAVGDNLWKNEKKISIFYDIPWIFCTLNAKYVNKYGLMQVFCKVGVFTRENSARNPHKVCSFSSLVLQVDKCRLALRKVWRCYFICYSSFWWFIDNVVSS